MQLGNYLATQRRAKRLTLADLAQQTGVSRSHLSKIETGRVQDPGFAAVVKIAQALGVQIAQLAAICETYPGATPASTPTGTEGLHAP